MGCLQLSGNVAEKPYYIESLELNVYSLEEINYVIYHHIDKIYGDFFSEELFSYIETDLNRSDLAEKLRGMKSENASVRDFIKRIFAESFYYSGADVADIASTIESIDDMSIEERMRLSAQTLASSGRLQSALRIYLKILADAEEGGQFYSRISFAIGVIYSRLFMCKTANRYFENAYTLYPEEEYLDAAITSSMIDFDDEELLRLISNYQISDEKLDLIRGKVNDLRKELSTAAPELTAEKYIEKWRAEYYNMLS